MEGMDDIQRNLAAMVKRMRQHAEAAGDETAHYLTSYAKNIAPWTDRTSNLRNSITGQSVPSANKITIYVSESMEYAPFVEAGTSRSRPYPALWPTVAENTGTAIGIFKKHLHL